MESRDRELILCVRCNEEAETMQNGLEMCAGCAISQAEKESHYISLRDGFAIDDFYQFGA